LEKALRPLPLEKHPDLLVGMETADDAGVYKLSEGTALVQTVDVITPIVDDPHRFGQIAAANAISDIYAMGGKPLTAMNIIGFPRLSLDIAVLTEILQGGLEKIHEAGAVLMGGHTVDDGELKYGLAVTGTVHPQKIFTNQGAQIGDTLVLTKALGTGLIATAHKAEMAEAGVLQTAVDSMVRLNGPAAEAMKACEAHACTDVTGFGFLGHAFEMASASGLTLRFFYSQMPVFPGAREYAAQGLVPGGAYCNQSYYGPHASLAETIPETERIILFDPQTSGGLLIAVPSRRQKDLLSMLKDKGVSEAAIVGEVLPRQDPLLTVEF
jgi:selenide,water dikinase